MVEEEEEEDEERKKEKKKNHTRWYTPVTPALRRWKQEEDWKFKVTLGSLSQVQSSLGYVKSCLEK